MNYTEYWKIVGPRLKEIKVATQIFIKDFNEYLEKPDAETLEASAELFKLGESLYSNLSSIIDPVRERAKECYEIYVKPLEE